MYRYLSSALRSIIVRFLELGKLMDILFNPVKLICVYEKELKVNY